MPHTAGPRIAEDEPLLFGSTKRSWARIARIAAAVLLFLTILLSLLLYSRGHSPATEWNRGNTTLTPTPNLYINFTLPGAHAEVRVSPGGAGLAVDSNGEAKVVVKHNTTWLDVNATEGTVYITGTLEALRVVADEVVLDVDGVELGSVAVVAETAELSPFVAVNTRVVVGGDITGEFTVGSGAVFTAGGDVNATLVYGDSRGDLEGSVGDETYPGETYPHYDLAISATAGNVVELDIQNPQNKNVSMTAHARHVHLTDPSFIGSFMTIASRDVYIAAPGKTVNITLDIPGRVLGGNVRWEEKHNNDKNNHNLQHNKHNHTSILYADGGLIRLDL